jgi:hypothetical protein
MGQPNQAFPQFVSEMRPAPLTKEREIYLQGNAGEQDNLIQRILADWNQMSQLDPAALRRQLLELQDEICDEQRCFYKSKAVGNHVSYPLAWKYSHRNGRDEITASAQDLWLAPALETSWNTRFCLSPIQDRHFC